jgi:hypothetical protein
MPEPYAKIIADSITDDGHRLVTVEAGCWRPVLAEQNTHRVLSRNSASMRAIPVQKILDRFRDDPMLPAEWGAERPGMQQGPPLEGLALAEAHILWGDLHDYTAERIQRYLDENPLKDADGNDIEGATRLHKGLLNRWMEVGLQQVQIITGTQWDGYFWQRCHAAADKNIRLMAEAIQEAVAKSEPTLLPKDWWHLPYFGASGGFEDDWDRLKEWCVANVDGIEEWEGYYEARKWAKKVSAGRCARVSLLNQDGRRDIENDLLLYDRLADRSDDPVNPPHASPLEHVATPWPYNQQYVLLPNNKSMGPLPRLGNFVGWRQMRHDELAF